MMKATLLKYLFVTLALLPAAMPLPAAEPPHWLAERARSSDLVVLAQLERVDYEYERNFPVSGEAWFRPLIWYKAVSRPPGFLIVREKGLHDHACYFDDGLDFAEPPRYLLFLVYDEQTESWRGHPDGCAAQILVGSDLSYVARWPQPFFGGEHGRGDETLQALVETMDFQGPGSRIDAGDLLEHQRRVRAERDFMIVEGTFLRPTRGIRLSRLRELMAPGLTQSDDEGDRKSRLEELKARVLEQAGDSG
ncbi:MAG: hypothetical protein Kow0020_00770 [Wenzhouxiangellaceae bacterium]